jgi:two-component system NtrC family response regulator
MIVQALQETRGNRTKAARELGLSRRGLLNKIKRYDLE